MNKLDSNLIQFNHIPITNGVKKKKLTIQRNYFFFFLILKNH